MKRFFFGIFFFALLAAAWLGRGQLRDAYDSLTKPKLPAAEPAVINAVNTVSMDDASNANTNVNAATPTNTSPTTNSAPLPAEVNLAVPFTSQAPFANWDLPYQEACEETAALMVHRFWEGKPFTSKEDADAAILEIVHFEEQHYGSYKDTTADETARFIRDLWGYKHIDVYKGSAVTIAKIKREVADGYPVILLADGQELGNPNFRNPGPIYHAVVVKGYTKKGMIITNDPGTRKGADYLYDPTILLNAVHDWNGGDVAHGQRVMIVIRGQ